MKFRPCIDLHDGKVKQIIGSTLSTENDNQLKENFVSQHSSAWYASLFKKDGLFGGHVIMLGKGNEQAALEALAAFPGGLQIGGGINAENALNYIRAGASHVIVSSYVFENAKLDFEKLDKMKALIGKEKLVIDLSCIQSDNGKYYAAIDKWRTITNFEISIENIKEISAFCDEILIHAVSVEGKQGGIDVQLVDLLAKCAREADVLITYAGGVSSFKDIEQIENAERQLIDFSVGSGLDIYGGKCLAYKELIKYK